MEQKRKVFVSFRFSDGVGIKDKLVELLEKKGLIIDKSEDVDRHYLSEEAIEEYLFKKLRDTSITIVVLTPNAVNYKKNIYGNYDDWLYDELRYSLYDRKDNATNGVIAVYTDDAIDKLYITSRHSCSICNSEYETKSIHDFDNLVRVNMMNVLPKYKKNKCSGVYDSDYDSYISLISLNDFMSNPKHYMDIAFEKRSSKTNYEITKKM